MVRGSVCPRRYRRHGLYWIHSAAHRDSDPWGLELDGLDEYITPDGTRQDWPTAKATIEFQQKALDRSVTLAYNGDEILLGLDFLDAFQQSLIIHRGQVILIDTTDLDAALPGLH